MWLVEQQDPRVADEGARDREPPLHAAGEVVDLGARAVAQLRELEQLVGARRDLLARQPEVSAVDDEVVARLELQVEVVGLRHDAQLRADLGPVRVRVEPEDVERPARARGDRADHAHGRGLAGAVRAEQPEGLAGRDLEGEAVDGDVVAVLLH
ncbi:hypothetical protein ABID70_000183 [Clavibacter michiganensis]